MRELFNRTHERVHQKKFGNFISQNLIQILINQTLTTKFSAFRTQLFQLSVNVVDFIQISGKPFSNGSGNKNTSNKERCRLTIENPPPRVSSMSHFFS